MPKRKATTQLSGLVGSDGEDERLSTYETAHPDNHAPPAKRPRGRPRSTGQTTEAKASKPAPKRAAPGRKAGTGRRKAADSTADPIQPRRTLRSTQEPQSEISEDELDSTPEAVRLKRQVSPKPQPRRGRKKASDQVVTVDGDFEYTPTGTRRIHDREESEQPLKGRPAARRRMATEESVIDDAQDSAMEQSDIEVNRAVTRRVGAMETILSEEEGEEEEEDEGVEEEEEQQEIQEEQLRRLSPSKSLVNGLKPHSGAWPRRRGASTSDMDRIGEEPSLRRKLGDVTKKLENVESKYQRLRQVGIVDANANAEKLRKQCEATIAASNELVASLQKELAAQSSLAEQTRELQRQINDRDTSFAELKSEADEKSSGLAAAQAEVKALQAKLAASRNVTAAPEPRIPGSAVKAKGGARNNMVGAAEAAQAAQVAQLKEELYSDFTGLIILDVKRRENDHFYDCIQTGVNGTLHFKLAVAHDEGKTTTDLDTAEFHYIPLFDQKRDRDLLDLLPDYLTEEITFSRQSAAKFYSRVVDTIMKRA